MGIESNNALWDKDTPLVEGISKLGISIVYTFGVLGDSNKLLIRRNLIVSRKSLDPDLSIEYGARDEIARDTSGTTGGEQLFESKFNFDWGTKEEIIWLNSGVFVLVRESICLGVNDCKELIFGCDIVESDIIGKVMYCTEGISNKLGSFVQDDNVDTYEGTEVICIGNDEV